MNGDDAAPWAGRIRGRLERLDLSAGEAARRLGLPPDGLDDLLSGKAPLPRGQRLRKLAEVLETSISYLVGLDPDTPPPPEVLEEDQGSFGFLAGDEEALLGAYRRLDVASRAAVLRVMQKMTAPEPAPLPVVVRRPARGR